MTPPVATMVPRRPHVKTRRARQAQQQQQQSLTGQIVAAGQAAATAAAVTQGGLTAAELAAWRADYEARLQTIQQHPEHTLGPIEEAVAAAAKEPLRLLTERVAQAQANATPCQCPDCHQVLTDQKYLSRGIDSRFGRLRLWRGYGRCPPCATWGFPADHALSLAKKAAASPYLQEIAGRLVTKMPPEQAVAVAGRLGLDLSRCWLHQEAHRQGLKAQARRAETLAQRDPWEDWQALASARQGPPVAPFTLVIEIDAWNIRERDDWGQTQARRQQGEKVARWHWVYMATVFRLDHRGQTAGGRALISERGYVATRLGLEALTAQLHRETRQRGLGQAQQVLVIADGTVWIWNLVKDRFPNARQRLDLWHVEEHLWSVAHDLHGQGTPEARTWVQPLLQQVRDDQTTAVIASLAELKPRLQAAQQEKLPTQIEYFEHHTHRMEYRDVIAARAAVEDRTATPAQKQLANEPLGSGAIESTCRQYQCRFKRTGQFWTTAGDEALLCLETFWRNDRWHELYPHAKPNLALN